jgi:hypothetical protein
LPTSRSFTSADDPAMTATLQLVMPGIDPRRDDLTAAEQAAHEATAACQDDRRADLARPASTCHCGSRAYGEPAEGRCWRCGRQGAP